MKTEVGGDGKMKRRREKRAKSVVQWGSLQKQRMKITWRRTEIVAVVLIRQRVKHQWKPAEPAYPQNLGTSFRLAQKVRMRYYVLGGEQVL